jgi:hypothetical protein
MPEREREEKIERGGRKREREEKRERGREKEIQRERDSQYQRSKHPIKGEKRSEGGMGASTAYLMNCLWGKCG